jgi:hypothetical protein
MKLKIDVLTEHTGTLTLKNNKQTLPRVYAQVANVS